MMQSSPLRIQPFAPTPYLPTQTPIARISLDEDVKLVTGGTGERDAYDTLAVIYGILVSLEFLERAYVRDAVTLEQYDAACLRLLSQYRTGLTSFEQQVQINTSSSLSSIQQATPRVADAFENGLDGFMAKYRVSFPLAAARIRQGQPAGLLTESIQSAQQEEARAAELAAAEAEQKAAQLAEEKQRKEKQVKKAAMRSKKGSAAARVAETVQCFITLMDALKLSFRAKDQLHPLLADLMTSLSHWVDDEDENESASDEEQEETIPDFPGKPKLVKWLIRTNQMKASEELSEEEVRDLFFEIESMYAEYLKTL